MSAPFGETSHVTLLFQGFEKVTRLTVCDIAGATDRGKGLRGTPPDQGTRLGRPKVVVDVARIATLRAQGRSWRDVAAELNIGKGTAQRAVARLPKII